MKSPRADGERFCHSRKFSKCGNTLCISHFENGTDGAKDPPLSSRRFIQSFLRSQARFLPYQYTTSGEKDKEAPAFSYKAGKARRICLRTPEKSEVFLAFFLLVFWANQWYYIFYGKHLSAKHGQLPGRKRGYEIYRDFGRRYVR